MAAASEKSHDHDTISAAASMLEGKEMAKRAANIQLTSPKAIRGTMKGARDVLGKDQENRKSAG